VLKTARGGYDGRGVLLARDLDEAREFAARNLAEGIPVLVEERVAMRRELAALVARSPFGQGAAWPVVETVQRDGICVEVIAPAQDLDRETASAAGQLALRLAAELGVVGAAGGRTVRDVDGELVVNELAMRPHNSGHWTMDGASHESVRAASARGAGLPARRHRPARTGHGDGECAWRSATNPIWARTNGCTICSAGSPMRRCTSMARGSVPAAKIGHVNVVGEDVAKLRERATRAAHWLSHAEWTDGWDGHG
jgi:5-(carboxyamino)imidazole ribonucleotide synthase